jgi:hypothetical protein
MRKMRFTMMLVLGCACAAAGVAQDAGSAAQNPPAEAGQNGGGPGGGYGQRGGRGGMGMMGRGLAGTVTAAAADHFTVKTFLGDTYTIQFGSGTRFVKLPPEMRREDSQGGGQGNGGGEGGGQGYGRGGFGGNPPQEIKVSEIKVGDVIEARGDVDAAAKSVGATSVALVDPERAKQMQEMEANFGKTWLMGKVTAVDGVKVTLMGALDNAPHTFVADENTTFRRRRDPITLADVQVGDTVRVDGALNGGVFTATSVGDMGAMQPGGPRGRSGDAPAPPQ